MGWIPAAAALTTEEMPRCLMFLHSDFSTTMTWLLSCELNKPFLPWATFVKRSVTAVTRITYNPHTHRNLWKVMFIIVSRWKRGRNADDCSPSNPHSKSKFLLLGHAISISIEKQVLENECGLGFPVAINPNLLWHGLWGTEAVRSWCRGTKIIRASSPLPVSSWMHPAYFWAGRCPRSQSYVFVYSFICFSFIYWLFLLKL